MVESENPQSTNVIQITKLEKWLILFFLEGTIL